MSTRRSRQPRLVLWKWCTGSASKSSCAMYNAGASPVTSSKLLCHLTCARKPALVHAHEDIAPRALSCLDSDQEGGLWGAHNRKVRVPVRLIGCFDRLPALTGQQRCSCCTLELTSGAPLTHHSPACKRDKSSRAISVIVKIDSVSDVW